VRRGRITVLNAYSVHPPNHGGRYRMHGLYGALARHAEVELVTLGLHEEGSATIEVAEGFREIRVARSAAHRDADLAAQVEAFTAVYDITALTHLGHTPEYGRALASSLARADVAFLAHPYMAAALQGSGWGRPFAHDSHNQEAALKRDMLPASPAREALLREVERAEAYACRESRVLFSVSREDLRGLAAAYGDRGADGIVVPNGTDAASIRFADAASRERLRRRLRIAGSPIALFLASGHRPNLEAAEHLFACAARMPGVTFALVGNVADAFLHRALPANVRLVGIVTEGARDVWLEAASVALNPVIYGGGTNLKLMDYFAAGTPVVSTEVGLRGDVVEAGRHALVAPIDAMDDAIRVALAGGPEIERMTREARSLVEAEFDWRALGSRVHEALVARGLV
jgi:glycosyltransferase involved in cell wall biosynthesis